MRAIADLTTMLAAPYCVVHRPTDPRPWFVMYQSGEAHGRATIAGQYPSEETANDVAESLNSMRQLLSMHF